MLKQNDSSSCIYCTSVESAHPWPIKWQYYTKKKENFYISTVKYLPVYSPNIIRDMITVKIGAELLTVSANETATFFKLTRPKTTVANL